MSRLNYPSMKCFLSSILKCKKVDYKNGLNIWVSENGYIFSIVWIQGKVIEVSSNEFHLTDKTDTYTVCISAASTLGIDIKNDAYLMVIGELINNGGKIIIRAVKVQDLTNEKVLQELWPLEVRDIQTIYT